MKKIITASFLLWALHAGAQQKLTKLWESDTTLAIPESVLPDTKKGVLYVSLINGAPWEADGKGEIALLDMNGKITNPAWITGLHAPKGMAILGNRLYIADMAEVVVVNIPAGKIERKIAIAGAQNLNDITANSEGTLYVSDSKLGHVHQIKKNGQVSLFAKDLAGVNGVKAVGKEVYILTRKEAYRADAAGTLTKWSELPTGGDGLEPVGNGDFIGTSWGGVVYYIKKAGDTEVLLDTREQKKNTADIGYDPQKRIVYIPTFFAKSVAAYQLQ